MPNQSLSAAVNVSVVEDIEDLAELADAWEQLLASSSNSVFLTLAWQQEWWRAFGGERLLVVVATRDGQPCAIAPLFAEDQMLFFVGSGGSDYLDFIGGPDEQCLTAMLAAAISKLPEFGGIGLYHLRKDSPTSLLLKGVARRLGLELHHEGSMGAPYADLGDPQSVSYLVERAGVRKEESRMRRAGALEIREANESQVQDWLDEFFEQHEARWQAAGKAGINEDSARSFYRAVIPRGLRDGWVHFTTLAWRERPVAFDISFRHGTRQITYLVSRDASIRGYSPGRVLGAQVIGAAVKAGVRIFDFGLGEEQYKLRGATAVAHVSNWLLSP
jgi:CelD/BcsL family acetyltransferase involved in cellulose biosynthesis